jgi:orotate phosphoribosyltransferase
MTTMIANFLRENGAFMFSKDGFQTKSGKIYPFETDLRNSIQTWKNAQELAYLILTELKDIIAPDSLILGVPETGSILAFLVNGVRGGDFPINMMRSVPKEYQKETQYTVLPLDPTKHLIVIEDDVVSGTTLIQYLTILKNMGAKNVNVVSVIDREEITDGKSVRERVEDLGYYYKFLVGSEDIHERT